MVAGPTFIVEDVQKLSSFVTPDFVRPSVLAKLLEPRVNKIVGEDETDAALMLQKLLDDPDDGLHYCGMNFKMVVNEHKTTMNNAVSAFMPMIHGTDVAICTSSKVALNYSKADKDIANVNAVVLLGAEGDDRRVRALEFYSQRLSDAGHAVDCAIGTLDPVRYMFARRSANGDNALRCFDKGSMPLTNTQHASRVEQLLEQLNSKEIPAGMEDTGATDFDSDQTVRVCCEDVVMTLCLQMAQHQIHKFVHDNATALGLVRNPTPIAANNNNGAAFEVGVERALEVFFSGHRWQHELGACELRAGQGTNVVRHLVGGRSRLPLAAPYRMATHRVPRTYFGGSACRRRSADQGAADRPGCVSGLRPWLPVHIRHQELGLASGMGGLQCWTTLPPRR